MKRVLGLYIPFLSTDRLRNVHNLASDSAPVATLSLRAGVLRIAQVNATAHTLRIRCGHTLAEGKALVTELVTYDEDPAADRHQLESLAIWANVLSPTVHLEGEDTLLLDVTGCERLFGGERNLLHRAIDELKAIGFTARGAIADTPGAAWALVHAHRDPAVVSAPGEVIADLALLPVWSLRIDARATSLLARVGVESVASLLHLPRSCVASRFGEDVLDRIDCALGDLPEVLTPHQPRPALTRRVSFGKPTTRMDLFQEAVRRVLEPFCDQLARQVAGVRHLFVTFYCPEVPTEEGSAKRQITFPLNLSQPTRSAKYLQSLLFALLDTLNLPAPANALMLWAREVDLLDGWQEELFATDEADARQLDDLVNRLTVRLGTQKVVRPELLSDHLPERAFHYTPCVDSTVTSASSSFPSHPPASLRRFVAASLAHTLPDPDGHRDVSASKSLRPCVPSPSSPRPLRLLQRPLEVAATAVVPEGPPVGFHFQEAQYTVTHSVGPERIETGWWRGPHLKRDYYRVTTDCGRRVWLFRNRDTGRWFLHGWFD